MVDEEIGRAWARKHDLRAVAVVPAAPRTVYPKSLEDLIEICAGRGATERIHAAGSHWALSTAAVADHVFVETHDPADVHQAMGRTLYDVVPNCLHDDFVEILSRRQIPFFYEESVSEDVGLYPIHIETGKRVYQLYAELDSGDHDPRSLAVLLWDRSGNESYMGPWAFQTLGGAGGQTVFGALTTGTHGGDVNKPPIADSVMAMHLVADGGKHYWIEPATPRFAGTGRHVGVQLTDDERLRGLYGVSAFGGRENFEIVRDDDLFDSVLISAGRFGIVYSIVLAAVSQYALHVERRLTTWEAIRDQIPDPASALYAAPRIGPGARTRFLQIAVCLTPHENFSRHLAGVTKRWNTQPRVIPETSNLAGRGERVGGRLADFDPRIQAPPFEFAGNSHAYDPDPARPGQSLPASFFARACSNGNFLVGVLEATAEELRRLVESRGAVVGAGLAAVATIGVATLLPLLGPFAVILAIVAALIDAFAAREQLRFGEGVNEIRAQLIGRSDPGEREAGLIAWQCIAYRIFSAQQADQDYEAISYAVMDQHDYHDRSCNVNVDSTEVTFAADDPMLVVYVDALLAFQTIQEASEGKSCVGYISLRFTGPTRALIGQQVFPSSCAVEVAGLLDIVGSKELIDRATSLGLNSNFRGIYHWGQRNESTQAHIQERFGDTPADPTGRLQRWRSALGRITDNGRLDGFSNAFTRSLGLEVVTPRIASFTAVGGARGNPIRVAWDCRSNPPSTDLALTIDGPDAEPRSVGLGQLTGELPVDADQAGSYRLSLVAGLELGGERRESREDIVVMVA